MGEYEPVKGDEEDLVLTMEEGLAYKDIHQSSKISTCTKLDSGNITHRSNSKSHVIVIGGAEVVPPPPRRHLASLDVFRGLTVTLMILVDDAGGFFPSINHSPWNGVTLADFVVPFFIFMVGLSLGLTYKKTTSRVDATIKAVFRTLKLLGLGLIFQGGYIHGINDLTFGVDLDRIRWWGILQRIALAYFLTALCEIWITGDEEVKSELSLLKKYRFQWMVAAVVTIVYLFLLYGLYVPDWEFQIPSKDTSLEPTTFSVKCGVRGDTGPACNAVGMVDRAVFGLKHLYKRPIYGRTKQCSTKSPDYGPLPPNAPSWCQSPFDPEGLLSSMMAIVTCLIGLHYGHIIVHFKDHKDRILRWMIPAAGLVLIGFVFDFSGMHVNKPLYTLSYMCITAGAAGILFTGIYVLVDMFGYRRPTFILEWMGMHALMIYVLIACNLLPIILQGIYWKKPEHNILRLIGIGS
ncbi:hypothetical protein GIB67_015749 [Kingdonia uniflora]|uniref:Heparan-alpha-glucosaminide N-acetyltransferase catalytic domain-containing protein n=1 Tax=Kingdonia uniflora TaxID=39325 RepID=A0A7J7NUC5_9MAGN|nr:hypothetical protein GIB67_015749 [Kingdonia uniflora]